MTLTLEERRARARRYSAAWKQRNPEHAVQYRARNADRIRERKRAYRAATLEQRREYDRLWRAHRRGVIGASREVIVALMEKQHGCCAICARSLVALGRFNLDHDHTTRRVRGLLCTNCNRALGYFGDNAHVLRQAANYVMAYRQQKEKQK